MTKPGWAWSLKTDPRTGQGSDGTVLSVLVVNDHPFCQLEDVINYIHFIPYFYM